VPVRRRAVPRFGHRLEGSARRAQGRVRRARRAVPAHDRRRDPARDRAGWRRRSPGSPTLMAAGAAAGRVGGVRGRCFAVAGRGMAARRAVGRLGVDRALAGVLGSGGSRQMSSGCCSRWSPTARWIRARSSRRRSGQRRHVSCDDRTARESTAAGAVGGDQTPSRQTSSASSAAWKRSRRPQSRWRGPIRR
jgi:hypothetical protein